MGEKIKGSDKPWLRNYKFGPYKLKNTLEPYPRVPMHQLLEDSAVAYPNQVAIEFMGRKVKYSELKVLVDKLANALAGLGVNKGDKVAVILPNCPQFIISDFAISKTGGVMVPCSTLHTAYDLEHEIGQSGAETAICTESGLSLVISAKDKTRLRNIIVTSTLEYSSQEPDRQEVPGAILFRDLIAGHEARAPVVEINPMEDLAYLAFTGGATGLPKGVMITHYNRSCNARQAAWTLEPLWPGIKGKAASETVIPLFHAWGHLGSHVSVLLGLRNLLVSDPRNIRQAITIMQENRPLLIYVVPTQLMRMARRKIGRLPVMFLSGAAPLPREVFDALKADIQMPITEGYGLTECGPVTHVNISCFSKITGFVSKEILGVGVPVPDTDAEIRDPDTGEELGAGESGEIVVRGPQTMKGYWPKPGSGLDDGWLHTGDIGRMDENGYFVLEDRIKDMANVGGTKVYTTEVDEVLFRHPGVAMAAAVGIPDPKHPGSEFIKAFITPKEECKETLCAEDIITYCKDKLPEFAIPRFVEFREELPLTVTEKIFKRSLREGEMKKTNEQPQPGNPEG
jgi:long-chain acyl-CoA synthetase